MSKLHKAFTLQEAKIQASILLKSSRASDPKAAKRFQRFSITDDIKLKHALMVIALENGFSSWANLKSQINFFINGFLNKWFAHYEEAKAHQQSNGGFLLPYKNQFFICEADYIQYLGLDPNDPDWTLIQWDWVHPSHKLAWQRLYQQWMKIQEKKRA